MVVRRFGFRHFLVRWVLALVLVLGTYNPTPWSYVGWVSGATQSLLPLKILVGVFIVILYVVYLRATWRSIGPIGILLVLALFGALGWVLVDFGLLDLSNGIVAIWVGLIVIATVMAIGMSWSHIRRRLSGQVDVDDVDKP